MLAALLAAALSAAPAGATPPVASPAAPPAEVGVVDQDLTAAAVAFPITLAKVEAYAAAVRMLREAAAKDPMVAAPFRSKDPFTSIAGSARRVEAMPPVKAILDHHHVTGRDFVLTPTVVLSSRAALLAERSGHAPPTGSVNPAGVALWRTQAPRLEQLVDAFMADLQGLAGP
jgi:hypothetical protein